MSVDVQAVAAALGGLREALVADGYDIEIQAVEDGVAHIRIAAGPEACEECLVPKSMMSQMMLAVLDELPEIKQVELTYPAEHQANE